MDDGARERGETGSAESIGVGSYAVVVGDTYCLQLVALERLSCSCCVVVWVCAGRVTCRPLCAVMCCVVCRCVQ